MLGFSRTPQGDFPQDQGSLPCIYSHSATNLYNFRDVILSVALVKHVTHQLRLARRVVTDLYFASEHLLLAPERRYCVTIIDRLASPAFMDWPKTLAAEDQGRGRCSFQISF